jgi:hypothetical protein
VLIQRHLNALTMLPVNTFGFPTRGRLDTTLIGPIRFGMPQRRRECGEAFFQWLT